MKRSDTKSAPLFDEKSVLMPPDARREFELAVGVLRRAFTSGSLAQLDSCVRHPQITMPRVRALNAARRVLPAMPLEIGPKFGISEGLLLTTLRLTDGTHRPVAMERQKGGYLLDWESLTGWCDMSFTELLTRPPAGEVLMRVHSRPSSAQSPFAGEKGVSLTLSHPAEKSTLSAFVPDTLLKSGGAAGALEDARGTPFTLRVRADAGSTEQGWVRVTGIICTGWVTDQ
ncbi:MAG: hypothetical protein JNG86_22235 [Verrucomicrobiaceae bacterium]|nr:hypothetical protein [Verrucomicrobiaceae bacterium]